MMRFEVRNGRQYVYEVRREGRRVVRTYVGTAERAGALAELDWAEHEDENARRNAERSALLSAKMQDMKDVEHLGELDRLIAAGITGIGLHRRKRGPLRKKRNG